MPVTARLSKLFYDRLGEQVANELVDWFNQVDATYRLDLRELNELNFARFDAKLEQRLAELHARLDAKIDRVTTELHAKLDAKIDRLAAALDGKADRADMERLSSKLDAKVDRVTADLRAELLRWMFLFWIGTVGPLLLAYLL